MEYTKGEWVADIRVGSMAVYSKESGAMTYLPCIPPPEASIFYKHGFQVYKEDGETFDHWEVNPEDEANAHLIAAAPAMYEALKQLLKIYKEDTGICSSPTIYKATMAITKAEGR